MREVRQRGQEAKAGSGGELVLNGQRTPPPGKPPPPQGEEKTTYGTVGVHRDLRSNC